MKKCLILLFTLTIAFIWLAGPVASRPRQESYRSEATAGFFKAEYDRLSDNPAYVGAKLDTLDFDNSITKEKNNLYTTLDNLSPDGRFLLGGIGNPGLPVIGGIGGYIELGLQTNPQNLYWNPNAPGGNLDNVVLSGSGTQEAGHVHNLDSTGGTNDEYDLRETLDANEERYRTENYINAKVAVGGIKFGGLILGASFERNTDDMFFNNTPGEITDKGGYTYVSDRLTDGFVDLTETASFDNTTIISPVNYILKAGLIMEIGALFKEIEAVLTLGYLNYEYTENNDGSTINTETGNDIQINNMPVKNGSSGLNNLESDEYKTSALQIGVDVQALLELFGWEATALIAWETGGLSQNEDRTQVYKNHMSTLFPNLATYEQWVDETGTIKYEGDGLSRNEFTIGLLMRKKKENLLLGYGIAVSMEMSEDKYSLTNDYRRVTRANDGDGLVEASDLYSYRTGSYTDDHTDSTLEYNFIIPIGLEYQATPTLCWRAGAVHITSITTQERKRTRGSVSDLYDDFDRDDISGNEDTNDGIVNTSTTPSANIGGNYSFQTEDRGSRSYEKTYTQANIYFLGLGYTIEDPLQVDVLMTGGSGNSFQIEDMAWDISITYIF